MNGSRICGRLPRLPRKSQAELQPPVLDYRCSRGEGNGLTYGVCAVQGYRPHMEDRHLARPCVDEASGVYKDAAFFAVFDGHGGDWVSSFCARDDCGLLKFMTQDRQLTELLAQQSPICDYRDCLRRLFLAFDRQIRREIDYQRNRGDGCGSTAVVLLLCKRHLLLANCGDSRGVVYIDYGNYYNRVTVDHSVSHVLNRDINSVELRAERQRFEGLRYEMDRDRGLRRPNDKMGHGLMVTRAFGDYDFKGDDLHNLVSAEPAINHGAYFVKGHERLALLASDGLWDVFGTEEACEFALGHLRCRRSVEFVCRDLVQCALEAGSRDNMTVLVVCFDKNVERAVDADARCLLTVAERLMDSVVGEADPELSDAAQQQLLSRVAERAAADTTNHLYRLADEDGRDSAAKCFARVSYFFWFRRARLLLQRLQRCPSAPSYQPIELLDVND